MKNPMHICSAILLTIVSLAMRVQAAPPPSSTVLVGTKVAVIVVQDTTNERSERVLTAIGYARSFKRAGADVHILFDGDGVQWLDLAYGAGLVPVPPRSIKSSHKYGEKSKSLIEVTEDPEKKHVAPLALDEAYEEQAAVVRQPEKSIVDKVRKNLDGLSQLGIAVHISGRAADRLKVHQRLQGKTAFTFVQEANQPDVVPELMAQGYKILIF